MNSLKKAIIFTFSAVAIFIIGFFAGMEFKAYQVRSAIDKVVSNFNTDDKPIASFNSQTQPPTSEPEPVIIDKGIGDEVVLATINLKVLSVNEKQTISASYGSPKVAIEGAKFVVVNIDITNTTDSVFYFSPDFNLIDDKSRKYNYYNEMIGGIDNYLMGEISPSIKKNGNVVYEIPSDAENYSLMIVKAGTNEVYKINLK